MTKKEEIQKLISDNHTDKAFKEMKTFCVGKDKEISML